MAAMNPRYEFHTIFVGNTQLTVPVYYQNLNPIGSGSQGFVVSADDTLNNRKVAIKKMIKPFEFTTIAKRAYRELKILKLVNHKNIIRFLDAFTPDDSFEMFQDFYLVTELMASNLNNVIPAGTTHVRVSFIIYQILCGVRYLHRAGIIHRDLKPSNIVLSSGFILKILDFGLARKNFGTFTKMTTYVETRFYRAPELLLDMPYTERVDTWAVGCIFAEILLGNVLFCGVNTHDQLLKIFQKLGTLQEPFLSRLLPDVSNFWRGRAQLPAISFEDIFPDAVFYRSNDVNSVNNNVMMNAARDLLSKMLKIDPNERITIDEALNHNYVRFWLNGDEEHPPLINPYDDRLELQEQPIAEWKRLIYHEIMERVPNR